MTDMNENPEKLENIIYLTFDLALTLTLTSKIGYPPPKIFVWSQSVHVQNLVLWAGLSQYAQN